MICPICGSDMVQNGIAWRTIVHLHEGEKKTMVNRHRCMSCGKSKSEPLEDAPWQTKYAWDVVEKIVLLKKEGKRNTDIARKIERDNNIRIPWSTMHRLIKIFGRGTL